MEYYSATKKNKTMIFAGKSMEHEIIMLSEVMFRKTKVTCFISYAQAGPLR
jgi:hypothetical protein